MGMSNIFRRIAMASIKDALEESITDNLAFVKYFLYAIPVFICYNLFSSGNMGWFYFLGFFTLLMLVSILIQCIYNVRNGQNYVLPTFNIFSFIATAFKAIFAVGPILGIGLWVGGMLVGIKIPIPIPNMQLIYAIIVWLLLGSIIVTSLILYSKTQKIKDAYNLVLISNTCIDILVAIIFYIPQLALVNGLIVGILAYLFGVFFTLENPIFIFLCCMALVINVAITGNYFAQIDYELVPREENN